MLRFTIRDLLWLVLVAALGLGWWLDRKSYSVVTAIWQDKCDQLEVMLAEVETENNTLFAALKEAGPIKPKSSARSQNYPSD